MANPFAPLNIQIATLIHRPRKPYYLQEKLHDFLHRTEINAIVTYVRLNMVAWQSV